MGGVVGKGDASEYLLLFSVRRSYWSEGNILKT